MPAKTLKTDTGKILIIKSIRLPNGNLVIPSRAEHNRKEFAWREVAPGTSDYKRWLPVAVDEPDPRKTD